MRTFVVMYMHTFGEITPIMSIHGVIGLTTSLGQNLKSLWKIDSIGQFNR